VAHAQPLAEMEWEAEIGGSWSRPANSKTL
jgi:hypothetical protein